MRATRTLQALSELGIQMSLLPGRKTLVWITPGFPLLARGLARGEWAAFNQQVKGLSNAAIQNQIAFYSVNQSESGGGADLSSASQPTLQLFSTLTGGRWYRSDSVEMPAYFTPGSFHRPWRCGIIRRATMVAWRTLRSIVAVFFLLLAATEIFACDAIASPACPFSLHTPHMILTTVVPMAAYAVAGISSWSRQVFRLCHWDSSPGRLRSMSSQCPTSRQTESNTLRAPRFSLHS